MTALEFLRKLFAGRTSGRVFLCSFANERADAKKFPPRDMVLDLKSAQAATQLQAFISKSDVKGRATYFAVNVMRARKRNKDEIAEINCLHVDIDFKGVVESDDCIKEVLRSLKYQPSAVVSSGHGLHVYWLLQPPLGPDHVGSTEAMLARLAEMLAGDTKSAEITRVLRMPTSHNSKNGEWLDVEVIKDLCSWGTYSVAVLDKWISGLDPLLTCKVVKKAAVEREKQSLNIWQQFSKETRALASGFDANELIEEMSFHDTTGHGIDDTHTRIVGAMVADDEPLEAVLEALHHATKFVYNRDRARGEPPWSEKEFLSGVKAKYRYFKRKDNQKEEEASESPAQILEAKKVLEPKKKLNGHKHHDIDVDPPIVVKGEPDPFNPFEDVLAPDMPRGVLPDLIEKVAFAEGRRMGVDPGVLAMSMLTCCAAIIPDQIRVKVKRSVTDGWFQSARIWTAIVGTASTKKSPAMEEAVRVVKRIDHKLRVDYAKEMADYKELDKEEKQETDLPVQHRVMISDITPEKAASLMSVNPQGLLYYTDELTGFFGGLDRYGNKGGGAGKSARSMWLGVFNGVAAPIDREGRDTPNAMTMSACVFGGIQPDVISSLVDEGSKNDGLVQRFLFIFAKQGGPGVDEDIEFSTDVYDELIMNLHEQMPLRHGVDIHFSEMAHKVKEHTFEWIRLTLAKTEYDDPQLAAHLGKWENIYVRLCLLFHVIDNWQDKHARNISKETAQRVDKLMRDYLYPHALAFYNSLGSDEEISQLKRMCKLLLVEGSKGKTIFTARDLQRGLGRRKRISTQDIQKTGSKLETLDWLQRMAGKNKRMDSTQWALQPQVLTKLARYIPLFIQERAENLAALQSNIEKRRQEILQ